MSQDDFDPAIDQAIDEVAKVMTSAPADPRLARRVAARLGERERRSFRPWILVPLASAAIIVLAVFVARERSAEITSAPRVERPPAPAARLSEPVAQTPKPIARPRSQSAARRLTAPLPAVAPIEIDRVDVQPLVVDIREIVIQPIAINQIEISAMP
jgi:hypothetical protein